MDLSLGSGPVQLGGSICPKGFPPWPSDYWLEQGLPLALDLLFQCIELLQLCISVILLFDHGDVVLDALLDLLGLLEPSPPFLLNLVNVRELFLELLFHD